MSEQVSPIEAIDESLLYSEAAGWMHDILLDGGSTSDCATLCTRLDRHVIKDVRFLGVDFGPDTPLGSAFVVAPAHTNWIRVGIDARVSDPHERLVMLGHELCHVLLAHYLAVGLFHEDRDTHVEQFGVVLSQKF